jgi:sugar/nucleoside kinase (ribokinase family)
MTYGVCGYSAEIIDSSLRLATLVKMNDGELEEISSRLGFDAESHDPHERICFFIERIRIEFSLVAVAVTRGSKGALLASDGKHFRLPDSALEEGLVRPVGAGDSFAAGLLFGIMQGWMPEHSLELAKILSNWVVQHVSATPPLPESVLAQVRDLVMLAGEAMAPEPVPLSMPLISPARI